MKTYFVRFSAVVAFALVSGCVANAPRVMKPLPPAFPLLSAAGRQEFDTADKWSFTQAVFKYPAGRDGAHDIPVGDYLLSRLVEIGGTNGVTNIKLTSFESGGKMGFGLAGRHLATLRIAIDYTRNGERRSTAFEVKGKDVGVLYSGEFSAIPFTSGGQTSESIFHDQIRPLLDQAITSFGAHMAEGR